MKKILKAGFIPVLLLLTLAGCRKGFEELTENTNKPVSAPASLILTGILSSLPDAPGTSKEIYSQYYLYNYDYYGNNRYDFGSADTYYNTLKNVTQMESEAIKAGNDAVNPYSALGKFFRAYLFTKMSLQVGDVPFSEALKGIDNLTPVYDTQKAVFQQALALLESANSDMAGLISANKSTFTGDVVFYENDLSKWQKLVNTFRLRLLIELSKKESDADLNIKAQFASILANPSKYPLMESSDDNFEFTYIDPSNKYPQNPDNFGQEGSRKNMSATYVGLLTQLKDPRVYVTAEPARYQVDNLKLSPTDFASFIGADPGLDLGVMYNNAGLQRYSFLNRKHFYSTYTGENSIQVGYPEMCFNIAEAINRGWTNGNAEDWYVKGIQASMAFYGIPQSGNFTAYFYRPGSSSVTQLSNYDTYTIPVNFTNYYNQSTVKYAAGSAGLTRILEQKYLALFRHSGLESYYTYRRTGVPAFATGPATGNGGRIAKRFQYPTSEITANNANYTAALQSQYGGNDDINGVMWILK